MSKVNLNQLKKSLSNMKNYIDSKIPTIDDSKKYILRKTITKNINFDDPDIITTDDKFKSVIKNLEITNESLSKEYISVKIQSDDGITFNKDITEYLIDGAKVIILDKSTLDANGKAVSFILTINRKAIKGENGNLTYEINNNYCTFMIRSLETGKHPLNDYGRSKNWTVTLTYYDINSKYYKKMYNIPSNIEDGMGVGSIQQKGNTSTGVFALGSKNNGRGFLLGSSNTSESSSCVFGKGNTCTGLNPGYLFGEGNKSHGDGGGFTLGSGNNVEAVTIAIGRKLTTNEQKNGNAGAMIIGQGGTLSQDSRFMISTANTNCGDIRYPFDAKDNGDTYIRGKNVFLETEDEITNEKSIVTKKYVDDKISNIADAYTLLYPKEVDGTTAYYDIYNLPLGDYRIAQQTNIKTWNICVYVNNIRTQILSTTNSRGFSFTIRTNSKFSSNKKPGRMILMDVFSIATGGEMFTFAAYDDGNVEIRKHQATILSANTETEFTPTKDYHPTTKKYVDDKVVGLATEKYVDDAIVQNDNMNNLKLVLGDNNTIKLMFGSKELSSITINGGGTVDPTIPKTYTITNSLSNATNSNSTASVKEGSSYSANITANSNYIITNVTVTMGGVDVTNAVYSNGKINISSVTGNIVITVTTKYDTSGGGTNPPVPDEDLSKLEGILKDRLLVWHDEFDGQTLDTSKWRYATANSGGSEQQAYTVARTENTRLENSNLILEARKDGYVNNWTWSSGRIDTSGLAGFKYGRLEAKLKYDVVSGAFPAFWTIGTCAYYPTGENIHGVYKSKGTQWAQNGEIDMFEGRGTNSEIAQGGFYNKDDGKGNLSIIFGRKNINASQYHVYAVEWTETTIISYIDGVETGRSDISDIESWHRPMYIILNMAVGSTGGYPADDCTSIKMAVDWVRVYAPKSVTKKVNVESISLTQNNLSFNMGDDPVDVYYTVNPTTAWDNNVNYESNNTSVAEVYGSRIYPKGIGNCKITARATNGVTATINVTVSQNASINSSSIALDKNTLEIYKGTNSTLIATATPGNHTDSILWKSSNDTVATVANGVVTGKGTGNCTITAYSSANSSVKAECSVSVKASAQLSGHPTSGLTLQLDRNGMSSTSWTNAVDNTVLQWKVANNNSSDIAPYMVFDGDSFYWAGANYKDHLTLDGFKNYYDFGESQTIILAGDFTNAVNPIFSNKQKLSQKDNLACMNKNGMSYSNASGGGLGSINLTTSEPNYNINGCIALRYNKSSLRADTDTMAFTSDTVNNKHVVLSSAFSQGSYPALLGNIGTAKIYWKVVLVYNRVLSDTEVQTAMRAIKTFLNS